MVSTGVTFGVSLFLVVAGLCNAAQPASGSEKEAIEWVTRAVTAPRVTFKTFESATAKTKVSYHIYLPSAYEKEPKSDFPVVYWLHGSGGGTQGIPQLARHFDTAIEAGKAPPFIVVFVNGMINGMYVDWKDGQVPMEKVIIEDLIPHIDETYRTIDSREGRMLDGFSMGGYGAARLGFKFPELFRSISILGAGPMQRDLMTAPLVGQRRAAQILDRVYGGDKQYFLEVSPITLAETNAAKIKEDSLIRIVVGDKDAVLPANRDFHDHLTKLKIPHQWKLLPGVAHDPMGVLRAMGDENWEFYQKAFGDPGTPID